MGLADFGFYLQIGLRAESWGLSQRPEVKHQVQWPQPINTGPSTVPSCQYMVKSKQCRGRQRSTEFLCCEELDLMQSTTTERELRLREIKVNSKWFLGLKCKSFEPRKATSYWYSAPRTFGDTCVSVSG